MGVPREHQIAFTRRHVMERAGVVEEEDAGRAGGARMRGTHASDVALRIAERVVEPDDLHRARGRVDVDRVVDEELHARVVERRADVVHGLVIVIPEAREDLPRHRREWREGIAEERLVRVRFHREKIAGEENQIGLRGDAALDDRAEAPHRHERTEMRIGDLHDPKRTVRLAVPARVAREGGDVDAVVEDEIELLSLGRERLEHADGGERIRHPRAPRMQTRRLQDRPRHREQRSADHERGGPADEEAIDERTHARPREQRKIQVRGRAHDREGDPQRLGHGREPSLHRHRDERVNPEQNADEGSEESTAHDERDDERTDPTGERENGEPGQRPYDAATPYRVSRAIGVRTLGVVKVILEGVTGTGKSSTIAALARPPLVISEEETFGELMDETTREPAVFLRRLDAVCTRLEQERPAGFLLERFHLSYFALEPTWSSYREIDARLVDLGVSIVLLVVPEERLRDRSLMREEYGATDWQGFVMHFGSEEKALEALRVSQARRIEALSLTLLRSTVIDTSAKDWPAYAAALLRSGGR